MSSEQDARRELVARLRDVYDQRGGYRIAGAPLPPRGLTAEQKRLRRNELARARRAGLREGIRAVKRRPLAGMSPEERRLHRNALARERRRIRAAEGILPVKRQRRKAISPLQQQAQMAREELRAAKAALRAAKPRKPRAKKGQRRPLALGASRWVEFVKMWRARPENAGMSYKEALKAAGPEWRALSTAQKASIVGFGMSGGRRQRGRRGGVLVGEQGYNSGGVLIDQFYGNAGMHRGGVLIDQYYQ